MTLPLISVLIPAFNIEDYVEDAIKSILSQSYENLEIIIVDDGSTDNTWQILEKLAAEDGRIRIFKNNVNKRIVETLNFAFSKANGTLIARMDGDDISLPDRLIKQYEYLLSNPKVVMVGLNVIMIDEKGKEIHKESYPTSFGQIIASLPYASPVPHFWLAKREIYEKLGGYRIPSAEDYDFILRTCDLGFEVNNIPDFLYLQRIRRGNTATAIGLTQRKSIGYVKSLHRERILNKTSIDSYSAENLKKTLQSSRFENASYQLSSKYHFRYIDTKNKSKLKSLLWLMLAIVVSPGYQLRAIYNRRKYKMIKQNA